MALLEALAVPERARAAAESAITGHLVGTAPPPADPQRLIRDAMLAERAAVAAYQESVSRSSDQKPDQRVRAWFDRAASLWWLAVQRHDEPMEDLFDPGIPDPRDGVAVTIREELAMRLAVAGLVAERPAQVRFELTELLPDLRGEAPPSPQLSWDRLVLLQTVRAFLLLVRKADGWADIDAALTLLRDLRSQQQALEEAFLAGRQEAESTKAAWLLLGAYHVAQMVTLTGQYLQGDTDIALGGLASRIERHRDRAYESLQQCEEDLLAHYANLLWIGCRELVAGSLWTHVASLGHAAAEFARSLASRAIKHPIVELWPGQQRALERRLLDPYPRAVIVEMPTSGGKTLLAEFSIVQTLALQPGSSVVYIAPTRALVNQVTRALRTDLGRFGLTVEMTVPAYELDPGEATLLAGRIDVLVTTPEKLDFLIRNGHPSVANLSMVVVDEAHHLSDAGRGARLELVLATIRRDMGNARFLLLSPFLPNAEQIVAWLGGPRSAEPIALDWKPNARVVGTLSVDGRQREVLLETLDAVNNSDLPGGVRITLGTASRSASSNKDVTREAARVLGQRGSTLVLCRSPRAAIERATEIAEDRPPSGDNSLLDVAIRYVDTELGQANALSYVLRRGVCFHHSGLSHETRGLIERLVTLDAITTVCGTSTLSQGVNFPISNVVVEDIRKGFGGDMSYAEFWNVAGRAGRTLMDSVGLVGFPSAGGERQARWQKYLVGETEEIASQLASVITAADSLSGHLGVRALENTPGLSEMLQFLAHAVRVSGSTAIAEEIEDLLRGSLVYHQERANDPTRAAKLVALCRRYLDQIAGNPGIAALSDRTGFATPSVGMLLRRLESQTPLDADDWRPDRLFGANLDPLTDRVRLLAEVPEITLGRDRRGLFSPEQAAAILRDWVAGMSIPELARRHSGGIEDSEEQSSSVGFARYLFGQLLHNASWGLGALRSVHLSGSQREVDDVTAAYVPSMVFFGVGTKEEVWVRMAGVPRPIAPAAARIWAAHAGGPPSSHGELRGFVQSIEPDEWAAHLPSGSLRPADLPVLWRELISV
jgi:replicative superfamily II helicase